MRIIYPLALFLSVLGAICVASDEALVANAVWIVSNTLMIINFYGQANSDAVTIFTIYLLIAVYGVITLSGVL